jgi:DNA-binding response OmpR family regulator
VPGRAAARRAAINVDLVERSVTWPGASLKLSPINTRILAALAERASVVRYDALIERVWGDDSDGGPDDVDHAMHTHVSSLRKRLASAGFPGRVRNVWGIGYELMLLSP